MPPSCRKAMLSTLNLVPFTTVPQIIPGDMNWRHLAETVSRRDADAEPPRMGSRRVSARCLQFISVVNNGIRRTIHASFICGTVVGYHALSFQSYLKKNCMFTLVIEDLAEVPSLRVPA